MSRRTRGALSYRLPAGPPGRSGSPTQPSAAMRSRRRARTLRGRWQTVGNVRTSRGGRFSWRYHFVPANRGRAFVFRMRTNSDIYPFAVSNSRSVRVTVRG
ncbi:MAG: hypothetical protein QOE11_922 [Solirubrobacteraceae bacterium]|jgi:hypothetical protein|nr:hypothetical protein [Solirubrobacteraceae bacterium]